MSSPAFHRPFFGSCIEALQRGDTYAAAQWLDRIHPDVSEAAALALKDALAKRIRDPGQRAGWPGSAPRTAAQAGGDADRKRPVIVIVTPCFNIERYLDETIDSVVRQRGDMSVHYHVQDAGSTDGTLDILRHWEDLIRRGHVATARDFRFTWTSQRDGGLYDGVNRGFAHVFETLDDSTAHSTIMTWINGDDVFVNRALWTAWSFFQQRPEIEWITGTGGLMEESGAVVAAWNSVSAYARHDIASGHHDGRTLPFIQQEGTFWRRSLWQRVNGPRADAFRSAGDWDLWRRFAKTAPLISLNGALAFHRRRKGQISADMAAYYAEVDAAQRKLTATVRVPAPAAPEPILKAQFELVSGRWQVIEHVPPVASPLLARAAALADIDMDLAAENDTHCTTLPSGRPWPKISIVTPSFNQGRYIAQTIESVLAQDYPAVEHIVIDALSTDETSQVLDRYAERLALVVREPDTGQSDALNKGFARASGEILCWLNSDDQLAPGALRAVAMAFDTHSVDIVAGICEVYRDGRLLHRHMSACPDGPLPLDVLLDLDTGWNTGQFFYQPEVFFTRDIWARAGSHLRTDCYYSMDYDLWCRFAHAGAHIHVIGSPLAHFRMHPEQKTADPSKFKAELVAVRDRFMAQRNIAAPSTQRPPARWDRVLRVAMVNDIGLSYGAGIAQGRLAAGIDMAGHDVKLFATTACLDAAGRVNEGLLVQRVADFRPDVVIFGNLHAADRASVNVIGALSALYPSFWITHDFWIFTGRCAYPGDCTKYLSGCDASCPTPTQYPELAPELIHGAWLRKQQLLRLPHAPVVMANSRWSAVFGQSALAEKDGKPAAKVRQMQLGVPCSVYVRIPRLRARLQLGLPSDHFIIAFSVSFFTDERKGGAYLLEALRVAGIPKLTLLLLGTQDREIHLEGVSVVSLGYTTDVTIIVAALSAANLYVGPSLAETFGQVFAEAAMVGTPSIGFDQSGVKDAIVHGVTGLRVELSAQALGDAIRAMYVDKSLRLSMGHWAAIYARNEFSLESSYRSLFNAWQDCGLVDRWQIPHRIGYVRASDHAGHPAGDGPAWKPEFGISEVEGPYPPEFPTPLRWCFGQRSAFRIQCGNKSLISIELSYYCRLFDRIKLVIGAPGLPERSVILTQTKFGESATVELTLDVHPGWCIVNMVPDRCREPAPTEPRQLSFMIRDIVICEPGGVVNASCAADRSPDRLIA